jgi:hypothetical protein
MLMGEYVLCRGSLAIATSIEVDKKATADLSTASSPRTTMTKMLAMTMTLREGSTIEPANTAFSYPSQNLKWLTLNLLGTQ